MVYDPVRGFSANRAGAKGWFTEEGRAYVTINSDGLQEIGSTLWKSHREPFALLSWGTPSPQRFRLRWGECLLVGDGTRVRKMRSAEGPEN